MKSGVAWALVLVLCLAAGLRGWAVHEYTQSHPLSDAPTIDEASYDEWAVDIASGDWTGEEVFFQEPLYPYFLGCVYAVSGRDLDVVRIIQVVLGVLTCWLVARLGRRLAGLRRAVGGDQADRGRRGGGGRVVLRLRRRALSLCRLEDPG